MTNPIIPEAALQQHIAVLGKALAVTTPTETDKAYAAGFFDGEGNICIARNEHAGKAKRYYTYNMRIGAAQVDITPLLWLRDRWGGSIGPSNHWYGWRCFSHMAASFLIDTLPYLQVKRERAQLALRFQSTIHQPGRRGHTAEHKALMADMKVQMNLLNARRPRLP